MTNELILRELKLAAAAREIPAAGLHQGVKLVLTVQLQPPVINPATTVKPANVWKRRKFTAEVVIINIVIVLPCIYKNIIW